MYIPVGINARGITRVTSVGMSTRQHVVRPMQYTVTAVKMKNCSIFLTSAKKIDCGYLLELTK